MKDRNKGGGAVLEEIWDAVVITTVWFDNPYFPTYKISKNCDTNSPTNPAFHDLEGPTRRLRRKGSTLFSQSPHNPRPIHGFTAPARARHRKCILCKGMAAQLAPVARSPVYRSTSRFSIFASLPDIRIQDIGPITQHQRQDLRTRPGQK
jgi:hypothetical protein